MTNWTVDDDHPLRVAWEAYKASDGYAGDDPWPAFMAGWDALRIMMENSPVYFAEDEGEVAQILGNTLAEASSAPKGKPS